jgi:hypothetical protein
MKRTERATKLANAQQARGSSTRPTVRGIAFAVVGILCAAVAYVVGRSELLYATGFLVLLPLVGYFTVRLRPLRMTVTRTFSPPVVTAGLPTVIELSVRNVSGTASPAASWSDRIPWFPHRAGPGVLPVLPAGGIASPTRDGRLGYSLRPSLRGVYDIGPLDVSYSDPFGLAVGRLAVGGSQSLYVVPMVVTLGQSVSLAVSGEGSARQIQHLAVGNDDDLMTREYRTGDALRRVHWRASARHGELMVRQEEQRSYPEARLLLDTRSDGYGGIISSFEFADSGFTWFEWAITMIASVGVHLHRSGFLVQVLETGAKQIAPLGDANQGSGQDMEFLLSLAGVRLLEPSPLVGNGNDERAQSALGPVFAVVADPSAETLRWISAQRRPYEAGVAFVIDTGNPAALRALQAAGWICVPVTDTSDPAQAWARVAGVTARTPAERR